MIFMIAVLLANDVDVKAPPECVALADVMVAVEGAGGLETAEHVSVVVDKSASIDANDPAIDPLVLTIDVALVGTAPLHRVAPLREVECKDVPDLVAVLIKSARTARDAKAAHDEKAASNALPAPDHSTAPAHPGVVDAYDPCDGPPACGNKLFGVSVGVGATVPNAARAQIDSTIPIGDRLGVVLGADAALGQSGEGYVGGAYRLRVDKVVVEMRGLVGVGDALLATTAGNTLQKRCAPSSTSPAVAAIADAQSGHAMFVAPIVAARLRFAWFYVEVGGTWQIGAASAPAAFVDVGVQLLDD